LVDNYALLQLDIVWCYLRLESVDQLPDASNRLQLCETKLTNTFGPNFLRVTSIKGKALQEKALFVRLYLLKGVVYFYLKQYKEAKSFLKQANDLVDQLAIDEFKLTEMIMLGFEDCEARLSLRASENDVALACEHALSERERKERIRKEAEDEKEREILRHKLGLTLNSNPVSIPQYRALTAMKFPKFACILALKRFDNDIEKCLQILEDENCYYQQLLHPGPPHNANFSHLDEGELAKLYSLCDANVHQFISVAAALFACQNNVEKAVEFLGSHRKMKNLAEIIESVWLGVASSNHSLHGETDQQAEQRHKREQEAQDKLSKIISNNEGNQYLDLDFKQEMPYIAQYQALLHSI